MYVPPATRFTPANRKRWIAVAVSIGSTSVSVIAKAQAPSHSGIVIDIPLAVREIKSARQQWSGVFLYLLLALALQATPAGANCPSGREQQWGQLQSVTDGDTLRLTDGRKLRLIAVNTPELGHGRGPDQPLAQAARRAVQQFFAGNKRVGLVAGIEPVDHYGRQLVHVFRADGESLSAFLLQQGLGWRIAIPPNLGFQDCLTQHEQMAQAARRGVWALPDYRPKPANTLTAADSGFGRVVGRVMRVSETASAWWIELDGLSLRLAKHRLHYFGKNLPATWLNRQITVSGWIIDRSESSAAKRGYARFILQLQHPSMIVIAP